MFVLDPNAVDMRFPPPDLASPDGLLAIGGDLRAERLLEAYRHGIFPWYNETQPILWWSPDPRAVLFPEKLKVSRSLRKTLRHRGFRVTFDRCFRDVMQACAQPRSQYPLGGTWITDEMLDAYVRLHTLGVAHSVETWLDDRLVGGLYGVALGGIFFGESMFTRETDASKTAFVILVNELKTRGFIIVDCQLPSKHLFSLGAEEIRRTVFLDHLAAALRLPDQRGAWQLTSTEMCDETRTPPPQGERGSK
jgi:leucyl/phenylalanyl-tRNA--protein transferase